MTRPRETAGFTLIELMIVVAIIAVLAAVAIIAYTRHIKSSRLAAERNFCAQIVALEETYYQSKGVYLDVSGSTGVGAAYPLSGNKFEAHEWKPDTSGDNVPNWIDLGAHPEQNVTYFQWRVEASYPNAATPMSGHPLYGNALKYGVPAQPSGGTPHAWFYVEGVADMDESSSNNTIICASSGRPAPVTLNEGQ